ncbi:MAG: acyl-CoA thioester hydrolase/BAAT C-terminal domain-containing protein [Phycisphaerales bacterium]
MRPTQSTVIHGLLDATVLLAPLSFIWRNAPKQCGRLCLVVILLFAEGTTPQHLAHAALPYVPRGIAVRSVRTGGLNADFFHGTFDKPQKAVILLGGSEGGKSFSDDTVFVQELVGQGFCVLSLAYFGIDDLPHTLRGIPLEYFAQAFHWLSTQKEVIRDDYALVGGSKGAELALLLGSMYPEVKAIIAVAPSSVVFPGPPTSALDALQGQHSAWSLNGHELAFVPVAYSLTTLQALITDKGTRMFENALRNSLRVKEAEIPVEKIQGPILLVSFTRDEAWPSTLMSEQIMQRLRDSRFRFHYEHVAYDAGHCDWSVKPFRPAVLTFLRERFLTAARDRRPREIGSSSTPNPRDAATDVPLDVLLKWMPGEFARTHDVYFGTRFDDVNNASQLNPLGVRVSQDQTATTYDPAGLLQFGKTYYWKVNEVNEAATLSIWEGDVWNFRTTGYHVVEDFEGYDDNGNAIFHAWHGGSGHQAYRDCDIAGYSGNNTGSLVGHSQPPYAEKVIKHSGQQSLPMTFDNSDRAKKLYSEISHEWPTAQTWTTNGVANLTVYVRGMVPGFVETSPGTFLMNGTGTDIWDTSDQFRYAYKSLQGNGSIIACVDSLSNTHEWAKAGVMIRESLDRASYFAFVAVTPNPAHGVSFQRRTGAAPTGAATDLTNQPMPVWVKLTRTGNVFTAQQSADGVKWADITVTPAVEIAMGSDAYVGLAVCSHDGALVAGARFSSVSTTGSVFGQWQSADIGLIQVAGNPLDTLYVAVEDSDGTVTAVSHPDRTAIATGDWVEWKIPLSRFTSAGVKLNSVKKLYLGIGDRSSPRVGGKGTLYVDDVRLEP